jgi:hypothetical protein
LFESAAFDDDARTSLFNFSKSDLLEVCFVVDFTFAEDVSVGAVGAEVEDAPDFGLVSIACDADAISVKATASPIVSIRFIPAHFIQRKLAFVNSEGGIRYLPPF